MSNPRTRKTNDTSTFERSFLTSQILNDSEIFSVTERRIISLPNVDQMSHGHLEQLLILHF